MKFSKANVPAPTNAAECDSFKSKIKTELRKTYDDATKRCASLPDLHQVKNGYFGFFKDERRAVSKEHAFTFDQMKDSSVFDPKSGKDTFHSNHTEATRKRCAAQLQTRWIVRSSQAYGWMPPIDDPKLGFGRGNIYHRDAMDQSHCNVGGMGASAPASH